jgi:hypothetical protein
MADTLIVAERSAVLSSGGRWLELGAGLRDVEAVIGRYATHLSFPGCLTSIRD